MVDLQSLVQGNMDTSVDGGGADNLSLLTTGQSRRCATEYEKLANDSSPNPTGEDPVVAVESVEATKVLDSLDGESSAPSLPAKRQESEEEKKQDSSYGQYSGFSSDYDGYNYDPYVATAYDRPPQYVLGGRNMPKEGGYLCCLFPWFRTAKVAPSIENEPSNLLNGEESVAVAMEGNKEPLRKSSSSMGEDDDVSTGEASAASDKLGERLSEKDRQAVLARLRLAQPDRSSAASKDASSASPTSGGRDKVQSKGLLSGIPNVTAADDISDNKSEVSTSSGSGVKGILKRPSAVVKKPELKLEKGPSQRRSLFPTYETNKPKKTRLNVQFSPMARVVTVKSQKSMSPEEKSSVWWQKWDYEDFRKTGRIITRAMLEGGSEIWLASNQSWQHQGASKQATLKNAMSLSEQSKKAVNGKSETADLIRSTGDKWWHKFGHSRRGLEHIASIKEGSERQANVRQAIRATLDEQRRQKAYMREDPEKLRMVAIHNTSWARDLALASGSSDADAVKSEFDEERKSREFYLLKMARNNSISSRGKHVPAFMQPAISSTVAHKLDANTQAQIAYRRKQQRALMQAQMQPRESTPGKRASLPPSAGRTIEAIHDPEPSKDAPQQNMAKRAAGFSHDGEQMNMAAVLSGMGAVPKGAQPVVA